MKDDVRMPEGEVGAKITKMFKEDEKETRKFLSRSDTQCATTNPGTLVVTVQTAMGEEAAIDCKEGLKS